VESVTDTLVIFGWDAPRDFGSTIDGYEVLSLSLVVSLSLSLSRCLSLAVSLSLSHTHTHTRTHEHTHTHTHRSRGAERAQVEYTDTFFHRTFSTTVNYACLSLATRTILFSPNTDDPLADGLQVSDHSTTLHITATVHHSTLQQRYIDAIRITPHDST